MRSRTQQSEVRRRSGARHGASSTPFCPTEKELLDHNWTIVFDLPSNGNSRHITLISRVTKSALFISGLPTIENESDDAFMCNRSIDLARGRSRLVRLQKRRRTEFWSRLYCRGDDGPAHETRTGMELLNSPP